jgi:hypothetical protein
VGTPYPVISLPILHLAVNAGDAGNGLCGGFSYTAMDMFLHSPRVPPPAYTDMPATNTSRFDYLTRRLVASFGAAPGFDNAAKTIEWTQLGDAALARSMVTVEWPAIKADIDAGRPSPLMLVMVPKARDFLDVNTIVAALKNGHQVTAYGYTLDSRGNLTLNIYDCNKVQPSECDQQTLVMNVTRPDQPLQITSNQKFPVRGFFRSNYRPDDPLPFMPVKGLQLDLLTHLQGVGDRHFQAEEFAGSRTQGLRLEGFQLSLAPRVPGLGLQYMAHVQGIGDTPPVPEGGFVGTRNQGRQIEGFSIRLTGPEAARHDVTYMAHIQGLGDTPMARNGEYCGTRGRGLRVEGMQVAVNRR